MFSLISIQVLPFLMLGVGTNDMFIIVKGYQRMREVHLANRPGEKLDVEECLVNAMSK